MRGLLDNDNLLFVKFPGVNAPEWPEKIKREFRKNRISPSDNDEPHKNYIYINLRGTVFSGHAVKTTLGNTIRSLCYMYHYFIKEGISETPWNDPRFFIIAAGDDTVIFCYAELAE